MLSEKNLFLMHVGQTSPEPLMIEIERAEDFNRTVLDFLGAVDNQTWTPRLEKKLI